MFFKIEDKLRPPPLAINDILLVTIDNDTLKNMPWRWPYSRTRFAKVVENLKKAEAKVIAFDFVFLGQSDSKGDAIFARLLEEENKVILPCLINEKGIVEFSNLPGLTTTFYSGIITKIQDKDGVTRKNLTYIVNENEPYKGILSWEMQILKTAKSIDLSTLVSAEDSVSFQNDAGEYIGRKDGQIITHAKTFPRHHFPLFAA